MNYELPRISKKKKKNNSYFLTNWGGNNNKVHIDNSKNYYDNQENSDYSARVRTLRTYEDWKSAKKKRKIWINVIVFSLVLIFSFISGNLLCKVGLTETKKIFSYGWGTGEEQLETENQSKLPKDYTEWYKKVKENFWAKKFDKGEDYWTKKAIAEREYEENKKKAGGGFSGDLAAWWLSKNLSEEEGKKIDHYQYAHAVYAFTALFLIISWVLFSIVYGILFNIVLRLAWKEPKLEA